MESHFKLLILLKSSSLFHAEVTFSAHEVVRRHEMMEGLHKDVRNLKTSKAAETASGTMRKVCAACSQSFAKTTPLSFVALWRKTSKFWRE